MPSPTYDLELATREALLEAIKTAAPAASHSQLEGLANAYALTVGASKSRLPGLQVSTS